MGAGDWLMAAGEARAIHARTGKKVAIVDKHGRAQWIDLWNGVPYILPRVEPGCEILRNTSGMRPYILMKTPARWKWQPYKPKPAEIRFTLDELKFAEPYRGMVMVEPNTKDVGHKNKAWHAAGWRDLLIALRERGERVVQCAPSGAEFWTPVTAQVYTPSFRHAAAVLSVCRAFIGTEGGLMHAAAAVGVRGVILWSEFISPDITGYSMHKNLRHAGKACGMRLNCKTCRASMAAITVEEVLQALVDVTTRREEA